MNLRKRHINNRKALALVAVLWMVVIYIVLTTTMAQSTRVTTRVSANGQEQIRLSWAIRGGVETAMAILYDDDRAGDSYDEDWSLFLGEPNEIYFENCIVSFSIVDECSKYPVGRIGENMSYFYNIQEETIDSIRDWVDTDDDAREYGAESGYYSDLDYPYESRNSFPKTVRELLFVHNVDSIVLYGEDYNGNNILDFNENDGVASLPYDNADDLLDEGLMKYLTCYSYSPNFDADGEQRINVRSTSDRELAESLGISREQARALKQGARRRLSDAINENAGENGINIETFQEIADKITLVDDESIYGLINVNTAPRDVLIVLFEGDEDLADSVMDYRLSFSGGMQSIADLLNVSGLTVNKFKEIESYITVRSSVFTVRCKAKSMSTGMIMNCEAVINRDVEPMQILYWYEGAGN